MSGLGANITDGAIQRVGKSLCSSTKILDNDKDNDIASPSGYHPVRSSATDMEKLLKQVHNDSHVFAFTHGRCHQTFPNFKTNNYDQEADKAQNNAMVAAKMAAVNDLSLSMCNCFYLNILHSSSFYCHSDGGMHTRTGTVI